MKKNYYFKKDSLIESRKEVEVKADISGFRPNLEIDDEDKLRRSKLSGEYRETYF